MRGKGNDKEREAGQRGETMTPTPGPVENHTVSTHFDVCAIFGMSL